MENRGREGNALGTLEVASARRPGRTGVAGHGAPFLLDRGCVHVPAEDKRGRSLKRLCLTRVVDAHDIGWGIGRLVVGKKRLAGFAERFGRGVHIARACPKRGGVRRPDHAKTGDRERRSPRSQHDSPEARLDGPHGRRS